MARLVVNIAATSEWFVWLVPIMIYLSNAKLETLKEDAMLLALTRFAPVVHQLLRLVYLGQANQCQSWQLNR